MFTAKVVLGFQIGRQLGYPTANVHAEMETGAFCGYGKIFGQEYKAIIFSGVGQTLNREKPTVEVHLLHDFGGLEFYDEELQVRVVKRMRDNCKFSDLTELKTQLKKDCDLADAILK